MTISNDEATMVMNVTTPPNNTQTTNSMADTPLARLLQGAGTDKDLEALTSDPAFYEHVAKLERWDLLPLLFKIKSQPFSLDDYPQFRYMYSKEYPGDMLYMCGRQVSKSTNLSRSEVLDMISISDFQVLYVAPLQKQADRYSNLYLKEAINSCPVARMLQNPDYQELGEGTVIKAVGHQAFLNGSGVQTMYAKTSADRARGITADRVDYDEIQDQLVDHLPIIGESLANSNWSLQRYCGTAKTTDNTIEYLWQQSSRSEWGIKCEGCNTWNIPDKDHNVLRMIHVTGPVCVRCRKPLNPRKGQLVHGYPEKAGEFLGVHVPQIFVPAITESPVRWNRLINKVTKYPESLIFTEILGISHDAGTRIISREDILKASNLGTHEHLKSELMSQYKFRVVGVDWGIAEVTSFTVACVLGMTHDGRVHCLFAKRYTGMNPEDIITDIARMANAYRCDLVAADFGVGYTNNALLMNRGVPVSQVQYTASNTFLKFTNTNGIERWMLDRNTALSLIFWGVKYGKIFFPNPEDSEHYTMELLSPFESVTETSSGMLSKKYLRDPSRPDDFCHALTFGAVMLMRLAGDRSIDIVPERAVDTGQSTFPTEGFRDTDSIRSMLTD